MLKCAQCTLMGLQFFSPKSKWVSNSMILKMTIMSFVRSICNFSVHIECLLRYFVWILVVVSFLVKVCVTTFILLYLLLYIHTYTGTVHVKNFVSVYTDFTNYSTLYLYTLLKDHKFIHKTYEWELTADNKLEL